MQTILLGLRKEQNISQRKMGELLSISEEAYRNKERGTSDFKMSEMFIIARFFNKEISKIFLDKKFTKREQ